MSVETIYTGRLDHNEETDEYTATITDEANGSTHTQQLPAPIADMVLARLADLPR